MDTEEINDGITKGTKKVKPHVLGSIEKKLFDDKYLPAMITLKRWISNMQFSEMTLEQTSFIFQQLRQDKNLKGHSEEFENCLQPDHELVTSPHFERGVVKSSS